MNGEFMLDRYLAQAPWVAAVAYVAVVIVLGLVTWSAVSSVFAREAAVAVATDLLGRLEGHGSGAPGMAESMADAPAGSPFLDGTTMTIAGAALLQRVARAVTRVGGNLVSTQVDLQGTQSKAGYISVTASCDVEQSALQKLLYDLEAGMPFLFVDQLVVQSPTTSASGADRQMRVQLVVSGQWQGAK